MFELRVKELKCRKESLLNHYKASLQVLRGCRTCVGLKTEVTTSCVKMLRSHTRHKHKRTAWGCRWCGRIPNPEKLAIIRTKIFNIWANYAATFTYNW